MQNNSLQIDSALIAVLILMVVLIALVVIILRSLSIAAGVKVRSDMLRMLRSYDEIIAEKTAAVEELKKELGDLSKYQDPKEKESIESIMAKQARMASFMPPVTIPLAVSYRTSDFGGGYSVVRDYFRMDDEMQDLIMRRVRDDIKNLPEGRGNKASALREQFGFDLLFRLTMMPSEQQLELVASSLNDEDKLLLSDYCEVYGTDHFDVSKFCDWLDSLSILENGEIKIQRGGRSIYEGQQVIVGRRLYDYSIGEREMG